MSNESGELLVKSAIDLMQREMSHPIEVRWIAKEIHYSQFYFQRAFRATTGITPGAFLSALRIQSAKELLARTSLPVVQVALDVGYQSQATFTRAFAQRVGVTPGRFRALVDHTAGRALGDVSADLSAPFPGAPACVVAPREEDTEDRVCFLGLFQAGLASGVPAAVSLTTSDTLSVPDAPRTAYQVMAASFPTTTALTDMLLGEEGALVGRGLGRGGTLRDPVPELVLRPSGDLDAPVLTAAPVLYLMGAEKFGVARFT